MPGYKQHLSGGAGAFVVTMLALSTQVSQITGLVGLEWLAFCLAGSLFPDVDIKSKGQYYFYCMVLLLLLFLSVHKRYDLLVVVSIGSMTPLLTRHRGLFHRWWFIGALAFGLWYLVSQEFPHLSTMLWYDTIFFCAGAFSHLWLDMGLRKMLRV